jgi:hypothetical protein
MPRVQREYLLRSEAGIRGLVKRTIVQDCFVAYRHHLQQKQPILSRGVETCDDELGGYKLGRKIRPTGRDPATG